MSSTVSFDVRGDVGVIVIDRPPVNAIDVTVRDGVCKALDQALASPAVKVILLACAGRTFLSGADLNELNGAIEAPTYYDTLDRLEASPKPVVAVLHGTAMGGGLETALACHYRVAVTEARMGMPEITLGIVPGAGGTQRMPRLIGARAALEMMIAGAPIDAGKAKDLGVIDAIVEGSPIEGGLAYAQTLADAGAPVRRTGDRAVDTAGFSDPEIEAYLASQARALKGRTTQFRTLEAIKASTKLALAEGLKAEDVISQASLKDREGLALRHIFFAEREVGKIPGLPAMEPEAIRAAAVVGAGTMGGGIAMSLANSGVPTVLIDVSQEALDRGLGVVRANYEVTVQRGRMTPAELEQRMGLITGAVGLEHARNADVVIEAVFEDMDLKKKILAELDKVTPPHTILGSNTSTLSVTELASVTGRPEKVVGLHFFSPAHVMRLLEIVRGGKTSSQTLVTSLEIARKLKKIGVVSGDAFGFIGNRMMQEGYFREAEQLLLEGAGAAQIDSAVEALGFAMGPNKVNDMAGVDVGYKVREELFKHQTRPDPYFAVSDALASQGKFGQKTGEGVFLYHPGDRTAHPNPATEALIAQLAADRKIAPRQIADAEIQERCMLPLVNVGAQLLDEGIAYRAKDIDVVWTSGYGFPRHLGGPMFFGDTLGLAHVLERVEHYHKLLGHYWKPADLLVKLAREGGSFEAYDARQK
ncbi:3-hydroxyacyl-CoA dehydrogenase NAD-binding domain-containing protein [Phenylobacterium sp.]|uniref:3-hydroxyacyl-CoA dehydrogenase NAD-binding domain-containing protein n=1 Tax=Phenylobacterium sp. TaxID=1871053 RepID=UPI0027239870|nr:3-hydroxyacyl-CoA dehydrogenase NAD-binding domain-containing protein [Phenylobacterium sp.]MDO8800735.1 3-hydroxyacyl-CoA dehydrogenase NAD-binding domain-containing protein [Phenylobacterium sp.]